MPTNLSDKQLITALKQLNEVANEFVTSSAAKNTSNYTDNKTRAINIIAVSDTLLNLKLSEPLSPLLKHIIENFCAAALQSANSPRFKSSKALFELIEKKFKALQNNSTEAENKKTKNEASDNIFDELLKLEVKFPTTIVLEKDNNSDKILKNLLQSYGQVGHIFLTLIEHGAKKSSEQQPFKFYLAYLISHAQVVGDGVIATCINNNSTLNGCISSIEELSKINNKHEIQKSMFRIIENRSSEIIHKISGKEIKKFAEEYLNQIYRLQYLEGKYFILPYQKISLHDPESKTLPNEISNHILKSSPKFKADNQPYTVNEFLLNEVNNPVELIKELINQTTSLIKRLEQKEEQLKNNTESMTKVFKSSMKNPDDLKNIKKDITSYNRILNIFQSLSSSISSQNALNKVMIVALYAIFFEDKNLNLTRSSYVLDGFYSNRQKLMSLILNLAKPAFCILTGLSVERATNLFETFKEKIEEFKKSESSQDSAKFIVFLEEILENFFLEKHAVFYKESGNEAVSLLEHFTQKAKIHSESLINSSSSSSSSSFSSSSFSSSSCNSNLSPSAPISNSSSDFINLPFTPSAPPLLGSSTSTIFLQLPMEPPSTSSNENSHDITILKTTIKAQQEEIEKLKQIIEQQDKTIIALQGNACLLPPGYDERQASTMR